MKITVHFPLPLSPFCEARRVERKLCASLHHQKAEDILWCHNADLISCQTWSIHLKCGDRTQNLSQMTFSEFHCKRYWRSFRHSSISILQYQQFSANPGTTDIQDLLGVSMKITIIFITLLKHLPLPPPFSEECFGILQRLYSVW